MTRKRLSAEPADIPATIRSPPRLAICGTNGSTAAAADRNSASNCAAASSSVGAVSLTSSTIRCSTLPRPIRANPHSQLKVSRRAAVPQGNRPPRRVLDNHGGGRLLCFDGRRHCFFGSSALIGSAAGVSSFARGHGPVLGLQFWLAGNGELRASSSAPQASWSAFARLSPGRFWTRQRSASSRSLIRSARPRPPLRWRQRLCGRRQSSSIEDFSAGRGAGDARLRTRVAGDCRLCQPLPLSPAPNDAPAKTECHDQQERPDRAVRRAIHRCSRWGRQICER